MKRRTLIFFLMMALGAPWTAQAQFSGGNGTSSNPYQIANATDWNTLASNVAAGETEFVYQNEYFCLTNDISVSTIVGTMEGIGNATATRKFGGNFDGQGHTLTFNCTTSEDECAPFRAAGYGTFKNLRIEGTIQTSGRFAAGLVSCIRGNSSSSGNGSGCTFRNCISNITIIGTNTDSSIDGTYGGLVSHTEDGKNYYNGCAFTGTFSGNGKSWGGLIGWTATWGNGRNGYLYDCLFAPTSTSGINNPSNCNTLSRNSPATIENCYYTEALGTTQGTSAYKVTLAADPAEGGMVDGGTPTTDYGFIKAYSNGLLFNGVYYANGSISLKATPNSGYTFSQWNDNNNSNPRTVNVSSNTSYTANFTQGGGGGGGSDGTLTIYDGTDNSSNIPFYGYFADYGTRSQFIIPSNQLETMAGGIISKLTFYSNNASASFDEGVTVYMKKVDYTTFPENTLENWSNMTVVYNNKTIGTNESKLMEIELDTPFSYEGGNLMIGFQVTTWGSTCPQMTWYGINQGSENYTAVYNNANSSHTWGSSYSRQTFLPKTTFTYTPASSGSETCEDFESGSMPTGWTSEGTGAWVVKTGDNSSSTGAHGGTYNVSRPHASRNEVCYLVMPAQDFSAVSSATLNFWYINRIWGSDIDYLDVCYRIGSNGTWTSLWNTTTNHESWTEQSVNLTGLAANYQIGFKYTDNWGYDVSIDDICIETTGGSTPTYITEIATVADWEAFCAAVNGGHDYSGEIVTMTADVGTTSTPVSTLCGVTSTGSGSDEIKSFKGTFDGQGNTLTIGVTGQGRFSAPFKCVNGATIRNLNVAGSISGASNSTDGKLLAGLVGLCIGETSIINCSCSATITGSTSLASDAALAGFVAAVKNSTLTIEGCVFTGSLISTNSAQKCAGIVGYEYASSTCTISNTVFAPTTLTLDTSSSNSGTFYRPETNATVSNCYYTQVLGTAQGKLRYTITGQSPVTVAMSGDATNYSASGIIAYSGNQGLLYNNTIIAGDGDNVDLNLSGSNTGYEANYGDLTGSNPYTLGMTANNTIITTPKLHIANTASETAMTWEQFAAKVNAGRTYSGLTVYLDEDITTSTMVGQDNNMFSGTFDGRGNTINFSKELSEQYIAPFRRINGATIKNVKVAGDVTINAGRFAGGVVAYAKGESTITNCVNSTNITSNVNGDGSCGGIIGQIGGSGTCTINGCVFNGTMTGTTATYWAGIAAYFGNNCKAIISDCLFAPSSPVNIGSNSSTIYNSRGGTATNDNCYYTETMNNNQGTRVYSVTGESPVTVAMSGSPLEGHSYNVSGLNRYSTGITFNNTIYGGDGDVLNLTLSGSAAGYVADHGTLAENGSNYTLTMEAYNTIITYKPLTKIIEAVGNENWEDGKGGYYLIASPLAENVTPNAANGFITDNYDLYYFSQTGDSEGNEWINFKDTENGGFSIVNGTGYLYASKEGTTLTFTGAPYSSDGEVTVTLSVAENTDNLGAVNLVGNPFAVDAYITKSFYTLENSDTYTPNEAGTTIHAMQGLLVVANEDGETLTFSTEAPAKAAKLNMNVTKGRALVDQAIISFNEGQQLPKLQFRNGSTKVYIPQEGKDYAIVSAESSMGEMPVNFKAENNGSYTLSFTAEEVSFAYLHLIDNMTGIETDLLANPSYSFDARTTDYESRFKLVFATGNNANDDAFAFYSNGNFVINNPSTGSGTSEATLQVIDMNGRILKSESINGCANVNVKAAAGVYVLRLVNGNDVKVQKVVVR